MISKMITKVLIDDLQHIPETVEGDKLLSHLKLLVCILIHRMDLEGNWLGKNPRGMVKQT